VSLQTLSEVDDAIARATALPMSKPSQTRIRAATLADLYEIRAELFEAAGRAAPDSVPGIYVSACEYAALKARETASFFRGQAESRRVKRATR